MREFLETSLAILALFGIIVGAIRWLLSVYYNQQRMLASHEKRLMDESLMSLRDTVDEHSKKIQEATRQLEKTEHDLKYTNKHLNELKDSIKEYSHKTDEFSKKAGERLSKLEVISENLSILRARK